MTANTGERLFDGADWDFATLQRIHDACEEIATDELGLSTYPNQIEVITAEQEKLARKIMEQYEPELDKLRDDIRHLELASTKARVEREKFLDKLLSGEQKKQLKEFDTKAKTEMDKVAGDLRLMEEELRDVRTKRDIEIEALLTPAQKERVKELALLAKARTEANKKAKASVKKMAEATKEPAKAECAEVLELCKDMGLLLGKGGLHGQTIRFSPPMCLNETDADFLVAVLDRAFSAI